MINFEKMENYLKIEKEIFVYQKDKITYEELEKLKEFMNKYKKTKVKECFEPIKENGLKWEIEIKCKECNKITKKEVSKSFLFEYLENKNICDKKNLYCEKCYKNIKQKKELEKQKELEEYTKEKENWKYQYIQWYLNKDYKLRKDYEKNIYEIRNTIISYLYLFSDKEIKKIRQQIKYKDFLQTPYWQAVSYLAKKKSGFKCQLCNNKGQLNVHHRTYKHIGKEIMFMDDLIVLCNKCHQKFHDIDTISI